MSTPPPLPPARATPTAASERPRRWPWWLAAAATALLLALLSGIAYRWRVASAMDQQVKAVLARHPIVTGHIGKLEDVRRTGVPSGDRSVANAVAYLLHGSDGDGVAVVRFEHLADSRLRLDEGILRMPDDIVYPLTDPAGGISDGGEDDPLQSRLEYARSDELQNEAPNLMVSLDSKTRSDLELIQFARRRLVGPLAHVDGVQRIYSLHGRAANSIPIMLLRLDAKSMKASNVNLQDVRGALQSAHFQRMPDKDGVEAYAAPATAPDASPYSPEQLAHIPVGHAGAPVASLGGLASLQWEMEPARLALGLVTSRAAREHPDRIAGQVRAALTAPAPPPDIRIDLHDTWHLYIAP